MCKTIFIITGASISATAATFEVDVADIEVAALNQTIYQLSAMTP